MPERRRTTKKKTERTAKGEPRRSWDTGIHPALLSLAGVVLVCLITIFVTERQIDASDEQLDEQIAESRRQVGDQIAESRRLNKEQLEAARVRGVADTRSEVYAEFIATVERHLGALGDSEAGVREADGAVYAALGRVKLLGSTRAYLIAGAIAARARRMTNTALRDGGGGGGDDVDEDVWFRQQEALDDFADATRPEVKR